ncbi:tetrathionate reductase family octaheme c-type cytochrome [Tropicimonas marinistellae]|uniref:tetrathionate reductase family octaheme c-type cytochrome n=1 Tax=Tropicimonas marinistellae TaxID=1739787 RepID=UPI00083543F5|nr:tetrathionate reductase family octaheme c-type cytochrome [Tropicimonas marinistellae]
MALPWLRTLILALLLAGLTVPVAISQTDIATVSSSTADHSQFEDLQGPFRSASEVSDACLGCHNTGSEQLHGSIHFTWTAPQVESDARDLGMLHVSNGFLLSVPSNLDACTSCHIAGTRLDDMAMLDASSDPVAPVDCLTCHEPTGQWTVANFHENGSACTMCHDERLRGDTPEVEDLAVAARSVGATTRAACGTCHFDADGGPGVKHGDLNADLIAPSADLDVHMSAKPDGAGFTCATCHTTRDHVTTGSRYTGAPGDKPDRPALAGAAASCQSCHSPTPHADLGSGARLDRHIDSVACETCHIPSFARGDTQTRVLWDWSSVGELDRRRQPYVDKEKDGTVAYASEKGHFAWAREVEPTLIWSDGKLVTHRPGDVVSGIATDDADELDDDAREGDLESIAAAFAEAPWIALYGGEPAAADSRIAPVKVMNSVIPIDQESRALVSVLLAGRSRDALWNDFRWEDAVEAGMEEADARFSGDVAFARVRQMIPVNHMVAPAEQALECVDCHATDGVISDLPGGFVPGRDRIGWLDAAGLALIGATLAAAFVHLILRLGFGLFHRKNRHG